MTAAVVSDIDGTLCVSARGREPSGSEVVVDRWPGGSAVTTTSGFAAWTQLSSLDAIVPATTRSADQLRRMAWPGPFPRFAIVANGAEVLVDGRRDAAWDVEVARHDERVGWNGSDAARQLSDLVPDGRAMSTGNALFAGVVCAAPPSMQVVRELRQLADDHGWLLSVQRRKVYLAPLRFGKQVAIEWLCAHRDLEFVAAAGDSVLDLEFLTRSARAACPADGEAHQLLADRASYVAIGSPVEQVGRIAEWLLDQVLVLRD